MLPEKSFEMFFFLESIIQVFLLSEIFLVFRFFSKLPYSSLAWVLFLS